jgi:hypothetical protein
MIGTLNSLKNPSQGRTRVEFGEEEGAKIKKWVRDAMPEYEYVRAERLKR